MEWPYIDFLARLHCPVWTPTLSAILGFGGKLSELLIKYLFVSLMTAVPFFMQVLSKDLLR